MHPWLGCLFCWISIAASVFTVAAVSYLAWVQWCQSCDDVARHKDSAMRLPIVHLCYFRQAAKRAYGEPFMCEALHPRTTVQGTPSA